MYPPEGASASTDSSPKEKSHHIAEAMRSHDIVVLRVSGDFVATVSHALERLGYGYTVEQAAAEHPVEPSFEGDPIRGRTWDYFVRTPRGSLASELREKVLSEFGTTWLAKYRITALDDYDGS